MVLSAQHCALAKAEETRKCCEELGNAVERLDAAQVTVIKASDAAKPTGEQAAKFRAVYLTELRRRRDEICELSKQFCQQCAFATAGIGKLAAVHEGLE